MTKLVGLTGGIASGKSAVADFCRASGIPVIDADALSRELSSEGGRAHEAIKAAFGTADRAKLREIIFADAKARERLERILHPLIKSESVRRAEEYFAQGHDLVIYEAALLVEKSLYQDLDGLIVVEAPISDRISRLIARDKCSESNASAIIAAQTSDIERRKVATEILDNNGTLDELRAKTLALIERLKSRA